MTDYSYGETVYLPSEKDVYAPDGSEIRLLVSTNIGSSCHCTLPAMTTSFAGMHKSVEEIWYCLQGHGQIWRKGSNQVEVEIELVPGICLTIPPHTHFQFRNLGSELLSILITTMPPWPGADEWIRIEDHWPISK